MRAELTPAQAKNTPFVVPDQLSDILVLIFAFYVSHSSSVVLILAP